MRVYNRAEFLKLPAGTIFAKSKQWYFNGLAIKDETAGDDWWELNPAWIDGEGSHVWFDRLAEMLVKGTSYPMDDSIGRDGMYDADAIFLIFEKADLEKLRGYIDAAISVAVS